MSAGEVVAYVPGPRYRIPEFELPESLTVPAADCEHWYDKSRKAWERWAKCTSPNRRKKHKRDIQRYRRKAFRRVSCRQYLSEEVSSDLATLLRRGTD